MLQRPVVSAVSAPAQGFVRLSPHSLCSFPGDQQMPAAKPFKSLRFHDCRNAGRFAAVAKKKV
jgi:hypothetical protein